MRRRELFFPPAPAPIKLAQLNAGYLSIETKLFPQILRSLWNHRRDQRGDQPQRFGG